MAYDGNGTFNRLYSWTNDAANGIDITASKVDAEDSGFAAGLSNAVCRDGQGGMEATLLPKVTAAYDLGSTSFKWNNAFFANGVTADHILEPPLRLLKIADQTVSTTTVTFDSTLVMTPVAGSYELECRLAFNADSTASPHGLKVGLNCTFAAFDSGIVTAEGFINGVSTFQALTTVGSAANSTSYTFATLATGLSDWIILKGTIRITNITGFALLGVSWAQNTGGTGNLTAKAGSYLKLTRFT